jgi:hypothetical protein
MYCPSVYIPVLSLSTDSILCSRKLGCMHALNFQHWYMKINIIPNSNIINKDQYNNSKFHAASKSKDDQINIIPSILTNHPCKINI